MGLCGGFSTGPEVVNASVEQASADNLAKLAAAEADERHLFVWVDYSAGAVELAVRLGQLPASPNLPEAIDTVWLARFDASRGYDSPPAILWRVQRNADWEQLRQA